MRIFFFLVPVEASEVTCPTNWMKRESEWRTCPDWVPLRLDARRNVWNIAGLPRPRVSFSKPV